MKNVTEMTLEELRAVPYCKHNKIGPFYGFVIVPTGELASPAKRGKNVTRNRYFIWP
jgi:hypothetical protein